MNKQIIKDILVKELSKCNIFNYYIDIGNLNLVVNTKKHYQMLIDNSYFFEGGIGSNHLFKCYESKNLYLSNNIWSKFENKAQLDFVDIQSIIKDVLEETFKLKGITPRFYQIPLHRSLEEAFKLKGITSIK